MTHEFDELSPSKKMSSLQRGKGVPKSSEEDQKVAEIDSQASASQPVALILVQSAEAEASVFAIIPEATEDDAKGGQDYVTGIRLVLAVSALILSATLIFLDNSILSTVRSQTSISLHLELGLWGKALTNRST